MDQAAMTFAVVYFDDKRGRHRFVIEPLRKAGHQVERLSLNPIAGLRHLRRVAAKLQALILIGLGPKMLPVVWMARRLKLPVIVRLGGDPERDMLSRVQTARANGRWLFWIRGQIILAARRWLLARADGLIVVNQSLIAPLKARLTRPVPITIAPQFCPGEGQPRGYDIGSEIRLLSVANLNYQAKAEGVLWLTDRLIERAKQGERPIRFDIAGGGAHLADVHKGLAERTLPPGLQVNVLGFVEDVDALYRQADLFLYSSLHDGTPNVLLEAKRFALPTLANDCEEFAAIVENNVSGLLYRDQEAFHADLSQLLDHQDVRQRLGEGALEDHNSRFSIAAAMRNLEAALAASGVCVPAKAYGDMP